MQKLQETRARLFEIVGEVMVKRARREFLNERLQDTPTKVQWSARREKFEEAIADLEVQLLTSDDPEDQSRTKKLKDRIARLKEALRTDQKDQPAAQQEPNEAY